MSQSDDVPTCYMCNAPATSEDHVPPKCIFPKPKDSDGVDYRKNLIKVPACDKHNNELSEDDELFSIVVSIHLRNNPTVQGAQLKKIKRAFDRNESLTQRIMGGEHKDAILPWGEEIKIVGLPEETSNGYYRCAEKIARGLYYHLYNRTWRGEVEVMPYHLTIKEVAPEDLEEISSAYAALFRARNTIIMRGRPPQGSNPDVFYFQVYEDQVGVALRMVFYESAEIVATFRYA